VTETTKLSDQIADQVAEPVIAPRQHRLGFSLIWLVPIVTAMIAAGLVYRYYANLGPLITITFSSAEGLEAGRTPIKRLNVEIGRVEKIALDDTLSQVIVTARMVKDAGHYLNANTRFWVVRPRIGISGITGLQTLLSGSYIELDSSPDGEARRHFTGLDDPPLTPEGAPGIRIGLHAEEAGSVNAGSPVFYRRLKVGRVESRQLSQDGDYVKFEAFINAPYHELLNSNTRFWNASGLDVRIDTEGVAVHSESLEALATGGIAFSNPPRLQEGLPVESGSVFTLYDTRNEAETQAVESSSELLGYVLHFEESLRGLKVGAPVELRGVQIGYVADIDIQFNPQTNLVEVPVLIFIEPQRIKGLTGAKVEESLPAAVQAGMRARLQTSSLLTGALFVDLVMAPEAAPAKITQQDPYPVFPTVPSPFSQITTNTTTLLATLSALPLDELVASATRLIKDADALVRLPTDDELAAREIAGREQLDQAPLHRLVATLTRTLEGIETIVDAPQAKALPATLTQSLTQLNATLETARNLLEGDTTTSPLYFELSSALQELTRAARAVRALTETLEEKPNALIFGK